MLDRGDYKLGLADTGPVHPLRRIRSRKLREKHKGLSMSFVDRTFPRLLLALSLTAFTAAVPHPPRADVAYPKRPVRIVVPFAVGGVADTTVRTIAEKLGD